MNRYLSIKLTLLGLLFLIVSSLDNGVGRTPPMGWNSWNKFNCNINEAIVKQAADILISSGLAAKGYRYVNIDDCWQLSRNATTQQIIEDKSKFPSGISKLSEYIHGKGLLFGLYSDSGYKTCAGRPGSLGYEQIDAKSYAEWKVDYLKYDNCYSDGTPTEPRYKKMRDALNSTNRPVFFSMCQWGLQQVWKWAQLVGNSWRTTFDIHNNYKSMLNILDQQVGLSSYSKPGAWNDPDMLQVGNGHMTHAEYQSHFALWAALKAPLLIGCNLQGMSAQTLEILGNEEVIAVNQDVLGRQVDLIRDEKGEDFHRQIWGGPLSENRYVLVCFNRGDSFSSFTVDLGMILPQVVPLSARQIVSHNPVEIRSGIIQSGQLNPHSTAMFVIKYQSQSIQLQ